MRGIVKKVLLTAALAIGAFVGIAAVTQNAQATDCSNNAIMRCGAYDIGTLRNKYNTEQSSPGLKAMYDYAGIRSDAINGGAQVHEGNVTKDNRVWINGREMANNAWTMGRQYIDGGSFQKTHYGATFYIRQPGVSFRSNSIDAFVFTDAQGKFLFAILKDCGNPVTGTPVWQPPKTIVVCDKVLRRANTIKESDFNPALHDKNPNMCSTVFVCIIPEMRTANVYYFDLKNGVHTSNLDACKPKMIEVCDKVARRIATIKESDFNAAWHDKNPAVCKPVSVCDTTDKQYKTVLQYEQTSNPRRYSTLLSDCAVPQVKVCDKTTKTTVIIDANKFDATRHIQDPAQCDSIKACDVTTKQIIDVRKFEIGSRYTTDMEKCKTYIKVCDHTTGQIKTIEDKDFNGQTQSKNEADCAKVKACDTTTKQVVSIEKYKAVAPRYVGENDDKCKTFIRVCDHTTGQIKTIEDKNFNSQTQSKNEADCAKIKACDTTTGQVVEIEKYKAVAPRYVGEHDTKCCKKYINVCDYTKGTVVKIEEKDFNSTNQSKDPKVCEKVSVCDTTNKQIVSIEKYKAVEPRYTNDANKCKTFIPVCDYATGTVKTIEKKDYDSTKQSDKTTDCDKVRFCNPTTREIVEVARYKKPAGTTEDVEKCKTVKVKVCDLTTGAKVEIDDNKVDTKKHSTDLTKCDKSTVCDMSDKTIKTVANKDLTDKMTTNTDACKPKCTIPGKTDMLADNPKCVKDKCTVAGKEMLDKDDAKCKPEVPVTPATPTPVTPTPAPAPTPAPSTPTPAVYELPKTGLANIVSGTIGLGAIVAASYYYIASRRSI